MKPTVGIVVALPDEAYALAGKARWRRSNNDALLQHIEEGEKLTFIFVQTGIGIERSLSAARLLVDKGAKLLLSVGVAGGLSPEVNTGDLVIAERIVEHEDGKKAPSWSPVPTHAAAVQETISRAGISVHGGGVVTCRQPVLTVDRKRDLYERTKGLAVDMESSAIARIAEGTGLPFLVMRAVSDNAEVSVPEEVYTCLKKNGQVNRILLLAKLLQRPGLIVDLTRLKKDFDTALVALTRGWRALTSSVLPDLLP